MLLANRRRFRVCLSGIVLSSLVQVTIPIRKEAPPVSIAGRIWCDVPSKFTILVGALGIPQSPSLILRDLHKPPDFINPTRTRTKKRAPVWGSVLTTTAATLHEGLSRMDASG